MTHQCSRPDCPRSFTNQFDYDVHLLSEHGPRWEEYDNYPRAPSQRNN